MVRTEIGRRGVASSRSIEHAAQPDAIKHAALHTKAHHPTRAMVHIQDDRGTDQPARAHEEHAHTGDDAIRETEIRCTLPGPVEDQELVRTRCTKSPAHCDVS